MTPLAEAVHNHNYNALDFAEDWNTTLKSRSKQFFDFGASSSASGRTLLHYAASVPDLRLLVKIANNIHWTKVILLDDDFELASNKLMFRNGSCAFCVLSKIERDALRNQFIYDESSVFSTRKKLSVNVVNRIYTTSYNSRTPGNSSKQVRLNLQNITNDERKPGLFPQKGLGISYKHNSLLNLYKSINVMGIRRNGSPLTTSNAKLSLQQKLLNSDRRSILASKMREEANIIVNNLLQAIDDKSAWIAQLSSATPLKIMKQLMMLLTKLSLLQIVVGEKNIYNIKEDTTLEANITMLIMKIFDAVTYLYKKQIRIDNVYCFQHLVNNLRLLIVYANTSNIKHCENALKNGFYKLGLLKKKLLYISDNLWKRDFEWELR